MQKIDFQHDIIARNAQRWNVLPAGSYRINIRHLLWLNDFFLKKLYSYYSSQWRKERGWEHERYAALFQDRDVLEIGGGLGYDGLIYSSRAKSYTYAELNELQIIFLKRIHGLLNATANVQFEHMADVFEHPFSRRFQAFYAHGVLHHVPFEMAKGQFENIDKYLDAGAIVVLLMYPRERWLRAGKPSFKKFGKYTDGGCPWAEYYDEEKAVALVGSNYKLEQVIKWGRSNSEFVNFEFEKMKN